MLVSSWTQAKRHRPGDGSHSREDEIQAPIASDARIAALEVERDISLYRQLAARLAGGSVYAGSRWSWAWNPLQPRRSSIFDLVILDEDFDEAMRGLVECITRGEAPPIIVASPLSRPADIEARLPDWGFAPARTQTGMWRRLDPQDPSVVDPRFERIDDEQGLEAWVATANRGFERSDSFELFRRLLGEPSITFYGLFEDGELVTTLFRHLRGDVVGLHTIATPPELRGRGYATAVTRSALALSAAEGRRLVVLQASALGRPVYERLGFVPCGELRQWEFQDGR